MHRVQGGERKINSKIRAVGWDEGRQAFDVGARDFKCGMFVAAFRRRWRSRGLMVLWSRFGVMMRVGMELQALDVLCIERARVPKPRRAVDMAGHAGAVLLPHFIVRELIFVLD